MILTKANLTVAHMASDGTRYATDSIKIEKDGTTVATDGIALVAVSPIKQNPSDISDVSSSISKKEALGLMRSLSKENKYIQIVGKNNLALKIKKPKTTVKIPIDSNIYPKWKKVTSNKKTNGMLLQMTLKKSSFLKMMKTIESASDKGDENVIYLEINTANNGYLRIKTNKSNGQELFGLQIGLGYQWNNPSKWELDIKTPEEGA